MKQGKRILSFILILALLVSFVPAGKDDVKEVKASDYQTIPDVILSDANENYPAEAGMKLFFPDITNVPASVYASGTDEAAKANGKLLAVYYKNTVHARGFSTSSCTCATGTPCSSDPYGEIHLVESTDNGETWSTPRKIVDAELLWKAGVGTQQVPVEGRDPNIAYLSDGTVILTFFTNHIAYDKTQNHTYILESHDGGATWSTEPVKIDYCGELRNGSKRGDIADFGDGYVLFPLQGHKTDDSNDYASAVYAQHTYNEEEAKWEWSFERCTDVTDGNKEGSEINECSFVVTGGADGNEVYALVRANGGVYHSTDRGANWTKVDTEEFQITDKDGNPAILNQPGLKLYTVGGEKYISVTYSVPNTVYGRPVYQKSVKLSDLDPTNINNTGWNNTKAELIYRCPNNTTEAADPSSVITNDGRILVVYYDGLMEYIGGTYIEELGSKSYTELTLGDFGVATSKTFGAFDANRTALKTSDNPASLSGIAISGIYNFKSTTSMMIGNVWSGISVGYYQDGNGEQIYFTIGGEAIRIYSKDIGGRSLLGRDISMRMTFDYLRQDSGTVDFIMGVTFDGYTTHVKFKNVAEGNLKQMLLVGNATVTNPAYAELLNNYEELTLEDFGIPTTVQFEKADHKVIQTVTPDASLDGKMVTGTYKFSNTAGKNNLVFGSSWFGVWIWARETYLEVYFYGTNSEGSYVTIDGFDITQEQVDGKSLLDRELNIKVFFDIEHRVDSGVDVNCGVIVNDAYYDATKFEKVAESNFKQAIGVTAPAGYPMTLKGNAEQLALEDYGIPKEIKFEGVEGKAIQTATPNEGLNGKMISGTFNFYNAAATNKAVFGSAWNGLWLMPSGDNLYGYYYDSSEVTSANFSITPAEVDGKALPGRDLRMQVYFNYGEIENGYADLKVVFIIEGVYAKSVLFESVKVTDLKQQIGIHAPTGYPLVLKGEAEELALKDFGVSTIKKYEDVSHTQITTSSPNESLEGKMISGVYNLSAGNILGLGSDWYGIWLMPSGDNLYGYYYDESGTSYSAFTITPSEVDGKALPGRDLKLQVYFTYGNVANNRANVQATFIVEDVFVKSVLFEDVSIAYFGQKIGITASAGAPLRLITKYLVGDFDIDGEITDIDFTTLRQALLNELTDTTYDLNTSGTVDVCDLVKLKKEATPYPALVGKTLSILGHSIDSYEGVSNDTAANSSIGNNSCTYGTEKTWNLSVEDMWWSQVTKDTGMELLVCNASSGSAVSYDSGTDGIIKKASEERAMQLHDDNGENNGVEPDVIAVTLGINDFRSAQGVGDFNETIWNGICTGNDTDGYTYVPRGGYFADHYAIMLHKMTKRYPNADVFVFNIFESSETLMSANAASLSSYNDMIDTIAAYFGVTVVDTYNDSGINKDNASTYTYDGLHLNAAGMKKYAEAFEITLKQKYVQ